MFRPTYIYYEEKVKDYEHSKQLLEKEKAEKSARMKKTDNPGPIAQTVGSRRSYSLWYAPLSVSHMIH